MVRVHPKKWRLLKWIAGIFAALLLIVCLAALYVSIQWKPMLSEKIKSAVYKGSNHLYQINFTDIHLNVLSGNLTLDSVVLRADTAVFDSLKATKRAPVHLFEVRINKLQLTRVGIYTAYFKRHINMNTILLEKPSINMFYNRVPKMRDTSKSDETLFQQIYPALRLIKVKRINIVDAEFDYYNLSKSAKPLNAIKHLDINVHDVLIDSVSQFDTTRMLYAKDINFELKGYKAPSKDKMYTVVVDTLSGSATAGTVSVRGFNMIPNYPDLTFSRKYSTQKDRYDLHFNSIDLSGVNFRKFNNEGVLYLKKLSIGPAKVGVFMNRELPPPAFDKVKNFPHVAVRRLPVETIVDTVHLKNVDVAYTEFSEKTKKRGTLFLNNLGGNIYNVTNDSARLSKNHHAVANLHTNVMGAGNLSVALHLDLTAANAGFTFSGHMGTMNLTTLNPLSRDLGLLTIDQGRVQKMDFSGSGNATGASGIVKMYYNNLKITMLEKDNGIVKKKGLLSFLANTLLVIDENPRNGKFRTGTINFQRTGSSSFFNLLWKGVFTGIRETVGIGMVPMKPPPAPKGKK